MSISHEVSQHALLLYVIRGTLHTACVTAKGAML